MLRSFNNVVLALLMALSGSTAVAAETEVSLRWALGALETEGGQPSAINRDSQLSSGDRLKFLVEPLSKGSVYLILLDSDGMIHVLFRDTLESAGVKDAEPSYIPPGGQWFKVDDRNGMETFFLLASVDPLSELETLLDRHAAAAAAEKKALGGQVVTEIRRQHKKHREFARPIEKPMMIGGQTRGTQDGASIDRLAVEVRAESFYAKTITIEH